DFDMPEGTPVLAVRDGVVALVVNNYTRGGASEEYRNKANLVLIRQPDGTYAEYDHLEKDSMVVKPGDRVHVGQPLARSGATGYASGPHLHLCIFTGQDGLSRHTLPTRFEVGGVSGPLTLTEGDDYTAVAADPPAGIGSR
ncbi:MAG: M23 family metallopeptidase, partial [Candidatus Xenobia bacterium]